MELPSPEQIRRLFAAHGLRSTRQREMIYAALCASPTHPTADELHRLVHESDGGISLATVYNALEAFTHASLARRIATAEAVSGAACRFDADMSEHCHIVAEDGSVRDVPRAMGSDLLARIPRDVVARIEREMGVRVDRVNIEFVARKP